MTALPSRFTPLTVVTADPTGILEEAIYLHLPSGAVDVVYDGVSLRPPYQSVSTRTELDPGLEYSYALRRAGGWPPSFTLEVVVTDLDANVSRTSYLYTVAAEAPPSPEAEILPGRVGNALTDDAGAYTEQVTDHEVQAHNNLIHYFQNKPRIRAVLASYAAQVQELETVFWALLTERGISSALGVNLDVLGAIVGEPRQDRVDEAYRAAIRVRVLVNSSDGQPEQLLLIASRMTGDSVELLEHAPAAMTILLHGAGPARAPDVARMLRTAKAGGVRLSVGVVSDTGRSFTWGHATSGAGGVPDSAPTTGWGSSTDAAAGGLWAGVL